MISRQETLFDVEQTTKERRGEEEDVLDCVKEGEKGEYHIAQSICLTDEIPSIEGRVTAGTKCS